MKTLCVLLHGYPNNSKIWKEQLPLLQDKYEVLNLSLPGSETGSVKRDELKLEKLARTILTKISQSSPEKVILVGHDIGAFVLAEVAKLLGDKVEAQIFLAGMDFGLFRKQLRSSSQILKSWYVLPLQVPTLPEKIVPLLKGQLSKKVYKDSPDLSAEAPFGFTPVAIYRELKNGLKNRKSHRSEIPTLFLFGKDDRFILPPGRKEIDAFYGKADVDVIPGGHWFMRENPQLVNERISDFLGVLS